MLLNVCTHCPGFAPTADNANFQRHVRTKRHLRRAAGLPESISEWYCRVCGYTASGSRGSGKVCEPSPLRFEPRLLRAQARRSDHMRRHERSARHRRACHYRLEGRRRTLSSRFMDPKRYL